jgi:uncharacterized protein (DUF1778 family)
VAERRVVLAVCGVWPYIVGRVFVGEEAQPMSDHAPLIRARSERLEARVAPKLKALIARAAALRGQTITDFIVSTASAEAQRAVLEHELLELTARDQLAFAQALLDPPDPSPKLREALERHKRLVQP